MPLPQRYRDQLVANAAAAHKEATSETRRDLLRTVGHLAFWVACGLALIGMAWHTTDQQAGRILWYAGCTVWISGVSFSLLACYRRGERRGDW